ncbi:MAG: hypothetical protein K8R76_00975 [Candidatus Aegiribacteria sp.]|nr:hypothetical protein [Candidatus Aegiribacteria sp.]
MNRADLARKLELSRARVTQMLNLLRLSEELIREIEELGDYWKGSSLPRDNYAERKQKPLISVHSDPGDLTLGVKTTSDPSIW